MALTMTPDSAIGTAMPTWTLPGVDGKTYSSNVLKTDKPTVIMFLCNHCPYVKAVEARILKLAKDFESTVNFFAICSNDASAAPEDSFEKIQETWKNKNYSFPYLYDEDQSVAKTFGAVCTPDFFLYDRDQKLSYRGRLDDSWKDANQVRKEDLKIAIQDLLASRPLSIAQRPSMGCSIKWK
ncbi:MAG: thioredoxin family protein [Bdellovibrionales bacterium]|nr:thioredoxin family protein [Bdellovibrionales bacterium]